MARPRGLCKSMSVDYLQGCGSLGDLRTRKKEESQKIDDLPVLVTCWSGTLAILSTEGNAPIANLMEALGDA